MCGGAEQRDAARALQSMADGQRRDVLRHERPVGLVDEPLTRRARCALRAGRAPVDGQRVFPGRAEGLEGRLDGRLRK